MARELTGAAIDLATLIAVLLLRVGNFLEFLLLHILVKYPVCTHGGFAQTLAQKHIPVSTFFKEIRHLLPTFIEVTLKGKETCLKGNIG